MRSLLVLFALIAGTAKPADACAVGSPCTKYRNMERRVYQPTPAVYERQGGGTFRSFTRSRVVAFLTGAQWKPAETPLAAAPNVVVIAPRPMQFIDAARAGRPATSIKQVLVRRIEYRDGVTMIEVDNLVYALEPCAGKKRMCLALRGDLSFDSPPRSEPSFSQPPSP